MMRRLRWIALTFVVFLPAPAVAQTYVNGRVDQLPGTSVVIASRSYPVFAIQFSGGGVATGDITNGLDVDVTRLPIAFNTGAASSTTVRTVSASDSPDVTALQIIDNAYAEVANDYVSARLTDGTNFLTVSQDWTASSAIGTTAPGQMLEAKDFDGAALPLTASAAEGDAIPQAGSLYGITYTMLVSEDGSLQYGTATTPFVVGGNIAHAAADSGNPLKIGVKATTSVSGQTMAANNNRSDAYGGIDGVIIERPHANLEDRVSGVAAVTDGSSTSLVAAQGSGIRFCATTLIVSNSSATNVTLDIRDGTAGAVIATIPAGANMGGAQIQFPVPLCTTANTAMAADPSAAASTVTTTVVGFKTKL